MQAQCDRLYGFVLCRVNAGIIVVPGLHCMSSFIAATSVRCTVDIAMIIIMQVWTKKWRMGLSDTSRAWRVRAARGTVGLFITERP